MDRRDAERREPRGVADAGKLEQLWRVYRAGREDDFAAGAQCLGLAVVLDFDADDAPAFDDQFSSPRLRPQREVGAL
jgi:hypothetical protein